MPVLGAFMFNAIYKFPAYQFNCQTVFTNKTWTDAYRGAGRPEATFAIERLMDELAAEVGVDPLEIREKNWIKHEEFPFTTVCGLEYDSGNYEAATAKAKEMFGYDELRAEQKQRRESGDPVQLGIGVSTFTEMCGLAPSRVLGSARLRRRRLGARERPDAGHRQGRGRHRGQRRTARATRRRSARSWPTGSASPFEDVEVLHGDTQVAAQGPGHLRLAVAGRRRRGAGPGGRQGDREGQADRGPPARGERRRPRVRRRPVRRQGHRPGDGDRRGRARRRSPRTTYPDGRGASIDAEATYDPVNFTFPHGTHLCAMEVDTETGAVKMRKYVCCDDIGNIINPLIVGGQVHGGLVQGIAQALWEEAVYDDAGTLVTGSFVDYLLPTAADTISFDIEHTTTPSTTNTLGTKGVGEAGTIASTPAVVNAVVDAVRHLGVNDIQMPCTPERVWKAINGAGAAARRRPRAAGDAALRRGDRNQERSDRSHGRSGPVIPAQFDYVAPTSVEDALAALAEHGDDAKIIAGGQSLLPVLRMRLNAPEMVIDLGRIDSLRGIRDDGDAIVIGAMTTHHDVLPRPLVARARAR